MTVVPAVTKTVVTSGAYGNADTGSRIGSRSASFTYIGDMYEFGVWPRVLDGTELGQLATYAAALYAL